MSHISMPLVRALMNQALLVVDSPLSYGILDLRSDQRTLNMLEFIWDSTKDCGIFVKV